MGNERDDPRALVDVADVARGIAVSLWNKGQHVPYFIEIVHVVDEISRGPGITLFVSNLAEKKLREIYPNPRGNTLDVVTEN